MTVYTLTFQAHPYQNSLKPKQTKFHSRFSVFPVATLKISRCYGLNRHSCTQSYKNHVWPGKSHVPVLDRSPFRDPVAVSWLGFPNRWCPPLISWFINHGKYRYITTIYHSSWSYKLTVQTMGPHLPLKVSQSTPESFKALLRVPDRGTHAEATDKLATWSSSRCRKDWRSMTPKEATGFFFHLGYDDYGPFPKTRCVKQGSATT